MFSFRLKEIMKVDGVDASILSKYLGHRDTSLVNRWLRGVAIPSFNYAIKVADYFKVSLDYLFGRSEDSSKTNFKEIPPFGIHFKNVLKQLKVTQYKLLKDGICHFSNYNSWFNLKKLPKIESLIKIADYLGVSLDYLVGRE